MIDAAPKYRKPQVARPDLPTTTEQDTNRQQSTYGGRHRKGTLDSANQPIQPTNDIGEIEPIAEWALPEPVTLPKLTSLT